MIGNPSSENFWNECPQLLIELREPNDGDNLQNNHKRKRSLVSNRWGSVRHVRAID